MLLLEHVECIVKDDRYNGFTNLIHWQGSFYLSFRAAYGHSSGTFRDHPDPGALCVLRSSDLSHWEEVLRVEDGVHDHRYGPFMPLGDQLGVIIWRHEIINGHQGPPQNFLSLTEDGVSWSEPEPLFHPGCTLWHPKVYGGRIYAPLYGAIDSPEGRKEVRLVTTEDGRSWETVSVIKTDHANETGICFLAGEKRAVVAMRGVFRPGGEGLLAFADEPFTKWNFTPAPFPLEWPLLFEYQGKVFVCSRRYSNLRVGANQSTVLAGGNINGVIYRLVGRELHEELILPSGCAGPGAGFAVVDENKIVISYYSMHEDKPKPERSIYGHRRQNPAIYLAHLNWITDPEFPEN